MKQENLDSLLDRFYKIADREIANLLRRGPTDLDAVCEAIELSSSMLLDRLKPMLGDRQWRIMVQRRLKHTRVALPDALRKAALEAQQPEFDFHDIQQFRGVPDSVTYEDKPGHVVYIHYLDTTKVTRKASRDLLAASIDADLKQLNALDTANEYADHLTESLGGGEDAVLRDILERWLHSEKAVLN